MSGHIDFPDFDFDSGGKDDINFIGGGSFGMVIADFSSKPLADETISRSQADIIGLGPAKSISINSVVPGHFIGDGEAISYARVDFIGGGESQNISNKPNL